MCGIIGYIGERQAQPILLGCLAKLEYRGYDSSGIAVMCENKSIKVVKSVGKVSQLEKKLYGLNINGRLGIAHSRWATHGKVTEKNTHPHSD